MSLTKELEEQLKAQRDKLLDLSGTNNKLIDARNMVKRVRTFKLERFLFFMKAPYISKIIPLINIMNSGNIELRFEKYIIC